MAGRDPLIGRSVCERAREWSSLRLDGELSLLEEELLERHLAGCESCGAFDEALRTTTAVLRSTAVEAPARPLDVPTRRGPRFGLERRRTAMIAAAALALGAFAGSLFERPSEPAPSTGDPQVSLLSDFEQLRDLPRLGPRTPAPVPSTPPNPPEGVI